MAAPSDDTNGADIREEEEEFCGELPLSVRVDELERAAASVRSNVHGRATVLRISRILEQRGAVGAVLWRTPSDYYTLSLQGRAAILDCHPHHLCKTILLENTACSHDEIRGCFDSRYFAVILQYVTKLDATLFVRQLKAAADKFLASGLGSEAELASAAAGVSELETARFRLAPLEVSERLTSYSRNATTPVGMASTVPLVISDAIFADPWISGSRRYVWLGGGEIDLKMRLPLAQIERGALDSVPLRLACVAYRDDEAMRHPDED